MCSALETIDLDRLINSRTKTSTTTSVITSKGSIATITITESSVSTSTATMTLSSTKTNAGSWTKTSMVIYRTSIETMLMSSVETATATATTTEFRAVIQNVIEDKKRAIPVTPPGPFAAELTARPQNFSHQDESGSCIHCQCSIVDSKYCQAGSSTPCYTTTVTVYPLSSRPTTASSKSTSTEPTTSSKLTTSSSTSPSLQLTQSSLTSSTPSPACSDWDALKSACKCQNKGGVATEIGRNTSTETFIVTATSTEQGAMETLTSTSIWKTITTTGK